MPRITKAQNKNIKIQPNPMPKPHCQSGKVRITAVRHRDGSCLLAGTAARVCRFGKLHPVTSIIARERKSRPGVGDSTPTPALDCVQTFSGIRLGKKSCVTRSLLHKLICLIGNPQAYVCMGKQALLVGTIVQSLQCLLVRPESLHPIGHDDRR